MPEAPRIQPRRDSYDAVVVGAGMAGLTCAALLARHGLGVLLVERLNAPGGLAHTFTRDGRVFDPAVRWVGDRPLFQHLLAHLGVADRCRLLPVDPCYSVVMPGLRLDVPRGADAAIDAYAQAFPSSAAGVRSFLELCRVLHAEGHVLPPALDLRELDRTAERFPTLFTHLRHTVGDVLLEMVDDPVARAALAAAWVYLGLAPAELDLVTFAQAFFAHADDSFYCEGSFQRLADAFAAGLARHGGELLLGATVTDIDVVDGAVAGVQMGEERVAAPVVVSSADATDTLMRLVGAEHLPSRMLRKLSRLVPSLSAFTVYAATDLDLAALVGPGRHEHFVSPGVDQDAIFRRMRDGEVGAAFITVPTLTDPTVAPGGEHLISGTAPIAWQPDRDWRADEALAREQVLDLMEMVAPGLRDRLLHVEVATPRTLRRWSGHRDGAMVGWSPTPRQARTGRPPHRTPMRGLYLAGHWTYPGGGVVRVTVSGLLAAMAVFGDLGMPDAAAAAAPPGAPPLALDGPDT